MTDASDTLKKICADKRRHIAARKAAVAPQEMAARAAAANRDLPPRGFARALAAAAAAGRYGLIAEIKKASPSKGLIRADFDPPHLARAYQQGGATCLSVLTDTPYFQGQDSYLTAAREAGALPLLRKDFMLDPYQIDEARALGADCVLLIMAALDDAEAARLNAAARALGMDVLVEVHNAEELIRARPLTPELIGINNRNLKTLKVDIKTTEDLLPQARRDLPNSLVVAESGLRDNRDLARLWAAGASAFLVGESLMREDDVTAAVQTLLSPPPPARDEGAFEARLAPSPGV